MPLDIIKRVPLFAGLPDDALAELQRAMARKRYPKQALVLQEGARGDSLYIIASGKVKVVLGDPDGKEVILSVLGAGDAIGELALIDDDPRSAGVLTMEASEFLILDKQSFRRFLEHHPAVAMNLLRILAARLRAADQMIGSLALMDVYGRVARTLTQLAEPLAGKLVITGRYTQKDIANMVGASREMVSRIFRDLTASGLIRVEDGQIIVNPTPRSASALRGLGVGA